jgi:hypothetical protein
MWSESHALLTPFFNPLGRASLLGLVFGPERGLQSAEEAGTMSPEEIIEEACKLPLHALERVAWILGFEVLGRMQECGEDQEGLGRSRP